MSDWKEQEFQKLLERQANYFRAVTDAGDLPWFAKGNPKRDETIGWLGLSSDISEEALRRAVWMRKFQ